MTILSHKQIPPGLEAAETFCSLGKILFPDPGVGWLPELPEDEELGRSFGSLALKLL